MNNETIIGNCTIRYKPTPLTISEVFAVLGMGGSILQKGDTGATSVFRMTGYNLCELNPFKHEWVVTNILTVFTNDSDVQQYHVESWTVIEPQWYELPGAFDEPVPCIVSDSPIDLNDLTGRSIRYVIDYKHNEFVAIHGGTGVINWKYALPIKLA